MKTFLSILGVIALLLVLAGALNHETAVSLDYLVGSTSAISLVWLALAAAVALLLAGLAGWVAGRAVARDSCGKLQRELESTYRRLRDCEARLPRPEMLAAGEGVTTAETSATAATLEAPPTADEAATVEAPPQEDESPAGEPPAAS